MSAPLKLCHDCAYAILTRYETPMVCGHPDACDVSEETDDKFQHSTFFERSPAGKCQMEAKLFKEKTK